MCASEALIQAKMGIVSDADSNPLIYDHTKKDFTIREGIIVAKNKKVFNVAQKRIQEGLGKSISEIHHVVAEESNARRAARKKEEPVHKKISIDSSVFEDDLLRSIKKETSIKQ